MVGNVAAEAILNDGVTAAQPPVMADSAQGGMDLIRLERILSDLRYEPVWRNEADKACEYYDGNQLDADTLDKLREKNLGPLITNLIKPTVDAVLGLEAKTRTDWNVVGDDEDSQQVADAVNQKLKEAQRESNADRATSDAYAGQVKAGFAAVEVSRATNPYDYEYRVGLVHRRELYWDWRSTKLDWSDARFLVRKRWLDADVTAAFFPQHAELIKAASMAWTGPWQMPLFATNRYVSEMLNNGVVDERRTSLEDYEWRDTERGRVCVYEVWYRQWVRGAVLELPNGRKITFDKSRPEHAAAVAANIARVKVGVFDKLRCAYFVGPHRVADYETKRRRFPYVPFFGYREDLTSAPYGLIRQMMSPQDEVNARRAKMMWLLSQKRVQIDNDYLDRKYQTLSDASRELARADSFLVTNPNRLNKDGMKIDENLELGQFQFRLLEESKGAVQQAGGVYSAMLGAPSNVTANSAMQTLIEQGTITLAEINDNYTFARRVVGDMLVDLILEDLENKRTPVMVESGTSKRTILLNNPAVDKQTGQKYLENSTAAARVKCGMMDVPTTPSYRAHQLVQLSEIAKSLPPEIQAIVVPFIIEVTDLPRRKEIAKLLRDRLGIPLDPDTPEGQAELKKQQEMAQKAAQLQERKLMAEVAEQEAKTAKLMAEAEAVKMEAAGAATGATAEAQRAFSEKVDGLVQQHRDQLAALQAQIVQLRAQAAGQTREAEIKAEADIEAARLEVDRERVRAEAAVEEAKINANADKRVQAVQDSMDQMRDQLQKEIKALADQLKESQIRAEERQRAESEAGAAARPEADDEEAGEQKPMQLTINVDARPAPTSKTISITKGPNGQMQAVVEPAAEGGEST